MCDSCSPQVHKHGQTSLLPSATHSFNFTMRPGILVFHQLLHKHNVTQPLAWMLDEVKKVVKSVLRNENVPMLPTQLRGYFTWYNWTQYGDHCWPAIDHCSSICRSITVQRYQYSNRKIWWNQTQKNSIYSMNQFGGSRGYKVLSRGVVRQIPVSEVFSVLCPWSRFLLICIRVAGRFLPLVVTNLAHLGLLASYHFSRGLYSRFS